MNISSYFFVYQKIIKRIYINWRKENEKEAEREWAEIKRKLAIVGLFSFGAVLAVIVVFGMRYWI